MFETEQAFSEESCPPFSELEFQRRHWGKLSVFGLHPEIPE
jgi:hypothetical protein